MRLSYYRYATTLLENTPPLSSPDPLHHLNDAVPLPDADLGGAAPCSAHAEASAARLPGADGSLGGTNAAQSVRRPHSKHIAMEPQQDTFRTFIELIYIAF